MQRIVLSALAALLIPVASGAISYTADNSVTFPFVDISGTGTQVLADDDDSSVSANIGFNFNFYGTLQSSLFISSNGMLAFGAANSDFDATNFSATNFVSPAIAPLWDDWSTIKTDFPASGAVYYQTLSNPSGIPGSRTFIVEWQNTFPCCPAGNTGLSFEVLLFEATGNILFEYLNVVGGAGLQSATGANGDNGSSAGVGIADANGFDSGRELQWSFTPGNAVITNGEEILFSQINTPEPSSLRLLGIGGIALWMSRRSQKRKVARK